MTRSVILRYWRRISLRVICFICIWICLSVNVLSPLLDCAGAKKQIFERIVPASKLHRGEEANIWIYGPRFQVSLGSRSEYLYAFAPTQNFQEIENNISNVYSSEVCLPRHHNPYSACSLRICIKWVCQGCAAPKATLTGLIMQILYFKRNKD